MEASELDEQKEQQAAKEKPDEVATIAAEAISKTESKGLTVMTVGGGEPIPGQNTATASAVLLSPANGGQHRPSARQRVKIEYPKTWKKQKHFNDGDIKEVAPETAQQFVEMGIATVVNDNEG